MKALVVKARLYWGYAVRAPGLSGARQALIAVPPSALVGALAYPCAYGVEHGAVKKVSEEVEWAAMGVLDVESVTELLRAAVVDLERSLNVPYMQSGNRKKRELWFSVQPMGKVYLPSATILVAYFGMEVDKFEKCAWGITRIGSKESLVAVEDVAVYDVEQVGRAKFTTPLYVRKDRAKCPPGALEERVPLYGWELRYSSAPPSHVDVCIAYNEYESDRVVKFGEWHYAL